MGFMVPVAQYFSKDEAIEYTVYDYADKEDHENAKAGWYSRLSAPGYLDCTDWSGPFDSADEALAYVMDLYEVDENGDESATPEDDERSYGPHYRRGRR